MTNPAKINLRNINSVYQSYISELKEKYNFLPLHESEQIKYRLSVSDKECIAQGYCKVCGCDVPELQRSKKACEGGCYKEMMSREEWEEYKLENNIILKNA